MPTPPNMSYMGPSPAMPTGLYDMSQQKSIPPEQVLYLSGQLPSGLQIHPQYLQQNIPQQMIPRQGTQVSFVNLNINKNEILRVKHVLCKILKFSDVNIEKTFRLLIQTQTLQVDSVTPFPSWILNNQKSERFASEYIVCTGCNLTCKFSYFLAPKLPFFRSFNAFRGPSNFFTNWPIWILLAYLTASEFTLIPSLEFLHTNKIHIDYPWKFSLFSLTECCSWFGCWKFR